MSRVLKLIIALHLVIGGPVLAQYETYTEQYDYRRTPNYDQTMDYLRLLERNSRTLRIGQFGTTPLGRPMHYVVISNDRAFSPMAAQRSGKLVVLIQNGIHSGEIEGKDACLALMRDLAVLDLRSDLLEHVILVVIPVLNIDGHEMMSPYNRINQNGPEEMGFRATSQNYNLNRDYLKLDAPEMRDLVRLWNDWDPDFFIDNHVTNGADHQYAVTYTITRHDNTAPQISAWGNDVFVPVVTQKMADAGEPIFPYVITMGRPLREGIIDFVESPRFSTGYAAARNRPGLLVEMHMLKDYDRRVHANYKMMVAVLELLNEQPASLHTANHLADSLTVLGMTGNVGLRFTRSPEPDSVDFLGYEYDMAHSDITDGDWIRYDTTRPVTMRLPYFNRMIRTVEVEAPWAYLIPPQWTNVIERLRLHQVDMKRLEEPRTLNVSSYRFDNVSWQRESFEGHHLVTCSTYATLRDVTYPVGTVVVPLAQRNARLIMNALEPEAPDAFFKWGFFDTMLEQKEYSEHYASEKLAARMLQTDAGLKREYEAKVASDSAFAADPGARWDFFYERSPFLEPTLNVYPVGRLMTPTALPLVKY
jgi:hypothetical protein